MTKPCLGDHCEISLPAFWEIIAMTKTFRTALFVSTVVALSAASLSANAQSNGPGTGGMMGGSDGWGWGMGGGMGWGMGGFGGIGLLVVVLFVVGFAFLAVRRRNS